MPIRIVGFAWSALAASFLWSSGAPAHRLQEQECIEASEFIEHAAMSRDNGYLEEGFIAKMEEDIALIKAYPPDLRWVVQDQEDEALLLGAVREVFQSPQPPEEHSSRFLGNCRRSGG